MLRTVLQTGGVFVLKTVQQTGGVLCTENSPIYTKGYSGLRTILQTGGDCTLC